MGPKAGGNSKAEAGRAKKAEAEAQKALAEARQAEAAEAAAWDEGAKKKSSKKAAEEEAKKARADRKAAADAEYEAEMEELSKPKKVTGNKAKGGSKYAHLKLTGAQIQQNLEESKTAAKKAEEREKKAQVNEYMGALEENTNSLDALDARSIEEALSALEVSNPAKVDKVNLRAAFEAFSETELAKVKEEKPGLKLSQYKELVWKAWQKSPANPLVQRG